MKMENTKASNVLSLMVEQFRQRHQRPPTQLVIAPLAALALAIKQSLAPDWDGIPVVCRDVSEAEVAAPGDTARSLAVFIVPEENVGTLRSCDLKT